MAPAPIVMNPTVLIICAICLIVAVILDNKFKFPLGITCILAAWVISFFAFGTAPNRTLSYFPTTVVLPLILAMSYFAVFNENGTSQLLANKILGVVKGNMKLYPWILFVLSTLLYICLDGSALRYVIGPIVFSIAKAGCGSTLMAISTAYLPFIAGGLNSFIGIDATTRGGIFSDMGLENNVAISTAVWLNALLGIIIVHAVVYIITGSWKVKSIAFDAESVKTEITPVQKKSLGLLAFTVVAFMVPPILKMIAPGPFTTKFAAILCNYTIFAICIILVLVLKLGEWRKMVSKASMGIVVMVTGVTFLIKTAQAAGLQELCTNIASSVPQWLIAPVLLIICGVMSLFVAAPTVQPMLFPLAASLAQTPSQAITYLTAVAVGLAIAGASPVSNAGAGFLAVTPEDQSDEYSKKMFIMAGLGVLILAIVAAVGGMSIFSGIFAGSYH
ncbi:MAG: hypothetical protein II164_02105 [Firmicutes bacterium]|nr:hypothetical protein [Bacillota bacterium]MBQ2042489.1 hypothetical protein [Bacillota bacterium]